ncbi:hypothetical protein [Clostridium sp. JS66]|nr:hypothetical protein [Clostridium sp. JS66]WPC42935.1 hypothetical protein Q6H37_05540 [Clostridium sp. JS66]
MMGLWIIVTGFMIVMMSIDLYRDRYILIKMRKVKKRKKKYR